MVDIEFVKLDPKDIRKQLQSESKKYVQYRPWEPWEDELIKEYYAKVPRGVLAEKMKRSLGMVSYRARQLNIPISKGSGRRKLVEKASND